MKYYKDILTNLISAINMPIDSNLPKNEKKKKDSQKIMQSVLWGKY